MRKAFFTVFIFFLFGTTFLSAQKIRLINTTSGDVTLKIQNEVTFDFDRLTLSAGATVELESESVRRVTIADSIHYYAINEIKSGVEQVTVYQLAAKGSDIKKAKVFDQWDEDDEDADIIIVNEPAEESEDLAVEAGVEPEAVSEESAEENAADTAEIVADAAAETPAENPEITELRIKNQELTEKLSALEERILRLEQQLNQD